MPDARLRLKIPPQSTVVIVLSAREVQDLKEFASFDPVLAADGLPVGDGAFRYDWTLDAIEDLLEWCAAAANHAGSRKIEVRLDKIREKLQSFLDSLEESGE